MRSRHSQNSTPPWWVWAVCFVLPLSAWILRPSVPTQPAESPGGYAPQHAWSQPPASAQHAPHLAMPQRPPIQSVGTISGGSYPAMPAYRSGGYGGGGQSPVAMPAPQSTLDASHPIFAAAESVSEPVPAPPAPVATTAASPQATSPNAPTSTTNKPSRVAGPSLLSPTRPPTLTAPLTEPHPTLSVTTQVVPSGLPSLDPPTPQEITSFLQQQAAAGATSAAEAPYEIATLAGEIPAAAPGDGAATPDDEAARIEPDEQPVTLGTLTGEKIDQRSKEMIAEGYDLARRGAYFAARLKFVGVLRMIAEAKDSRHGAVRRAAALAEGLQALDEAEDFLSIPAAADAKQETSVLLRSHKTDLDRAGSAAELPPARLASLYYRHAHRKLASAVAGEPAGSMALHALGKLTTEQYAAAATDFPLALRRAVAYQQAALLARDDNYLAAHELGVLLAETGHYPEASDLLRQVAAQQPNPVVLRNLARVERSLGRQQAAQLAEQEATRLAAIVPDPRVNWVPPGQFSNGDGAAGLTNQTPPMHTPYSVPQTANRPQAAAPAGGVPANLRFMR